MTTWHIVCRDCTAENVVDGSERKIRSLVDLHTEGYPDHYVEYEEVER